MTVVGELQESKMPAVAGKDAPRGLGRGSPPRAGTAGKGQPTQGGDVQPGLDCAVGMHTPAQGLWRHFCVLWGRSFQGGSGEH